MSVNSTESDKEQIACIVCTDCPSVDLQVMDVQMQCGTCDCGLIAIAFTAAIVFGAHPEQSVIFDQQQMRRHLKLLWQCFWQQKIDVPCVKTHRGTAGRTKSNGSVSVYCVCRLPEMADTQYILYKEWYHTDSCITSGLNSLIGSAIKLMSS